MDRPTKQPFICSEVCVCCFRCEMTCPKGAIEHDDKNHDARHIRFNVGNRPVPALESQTIGVMPSGNDANGKPHNARLHSVSNPQDDEWPGFKNMLLTIKRYKKEVCSYYICGIYDIEAGVEAAMTKIASNSGQNNKDLPDQLRTNDRYHAESF